MTEGDLPSPGIYRLLPDLRFRLHFVGNMGGHRSRSTVQSAEWRSCVASIWQYSSWCRNLPHSIIFGRDGFHVSVSSIASLRAQVLSCHSDPVVGAQYRWSAQFAPIWPRFWGLFQGWMTVFAWICSTTASLAYLAQATQALVSLNNPAYAAQPWHITLLMMAFVVPPFFANLWFKKIINWMELIGAVGHGVFWIVTMATLGATASKSSHSFVWGTLTNDLSGWRQSIVNFGIGLVPVAFPLTSFDGIIHMSKYLGFCCINIPGQG